MEPYNVGTVCVTCPLCFGFYLRDDYIFPCALSALLRAATLRARGGGMNRATHGSKTKQRFVFRAAFAARSRRLLRTANAVRKALRKAQRFMPHPPHASRRAVPPPRFRGGQVRFAFIDRFVTKMLVDSKHFVCFTEKHFTTNLAAKDNFPCPSR